MEGSFIINGKKRTLHFKSTETLLTALRNNNFTEVKEGCREGLCGSCLILLNGVLVNSCQVFAATASGKNITTVKGIGTIHSPHIIQKAFVKAGAVQCGFCTPGMILATYNLLEKIPNPTDDDIKRYLDGNLCRCTGYVKIIDAVKLSSQLLSQNFCHC